MSASNNRFQDSDSDTSGGPPTPTKGTTCDGDLDKGTTYAHHPDKRRHTRTDPRKRYSKKGDGSNQDHYEPIDGQVGEAKLAFDCNDIFHAQQGSCDTYDRTGTPMSGALSELGTEYWRFALHIIFNIPWLVSFIASQPRGGLITDKLQDMRNGSISQYDFANDFEVILTRFVETTCKKIYPSCTHIRIHSSLIPPLQYLSKLARDANDIYFHLLDNITLESKSNSPIIHKLISVDVTTKLSQGKSLGCEHSPHSHILKEYMSKETCNTLPIILNVSIQRNYMEHLTLTLPTDVAHTQPKKKIIFEKTLTLTSDDRTFTYTLVAVVIRNDGEDTLVHPQTICKQQDQWVVYNNDQTTLAQSTDIFQDKNIQEQVTLLVYEANDAFNMNLSLHSTIHNSHPEEGDVKQCHILAANVLVDLNRHTEKGTGKPQKKNEDRPAKRRRNIIITSTMQSPMPSQAKNILFTTTKPKNNETDSLFSLDMSVPTNQEKAAFIRYNIPPQYWKEKTENDHVIFHFGDEIIPVAIHMWYEEKSRRNETTDIPELMENYIQVMLIR